MLFLHSFVRRNTPLAKVLIPASLVCATILTGCGMGDPAGPSAVPMASLSGIVHGGNSPVTGSTINLYATVSTATGGTAPSYSLAGAAGVNLLATTTSDGTGSFNFGPTPGYTCPIGQYAYIQAVGGNPGLGSTPSSSPINLVAAIGPCSGLSTSTTVLINEVTTVAAAYALSGFANSAQFGFLTDSTNVTGLGHAFLNAANLVGLTNGPNGANTATTSGAGIVPAAEINTLADILEDCVNSTGTASSACTNLFAAATPPVITGVAAPTDSWSAALDIARYPASNPSGVFNLVSATPAFLPTLTGQPADWTVAIQYPNLSGVQYLAVDGNDNVYVSEDNSSYQIPPATSTYNNSIVQITSNGAVSTTNLVYNSGSPTLSLFSDPVVMTVDTKNNLWVTNGGAAIVPTAKAVYGPSNSNLVFELPANDGTPASFQTTGFDDPQAVAVDSANNIWVGNGSTTGTDTIYGLSELSYPTYSLLTFGTAGAGGKTAAGCTGMAVDASQTVWCGTGFSYRMERFYSPYSAAPTALSLTDDDPKQVAIDAAGNGWTAMSFYSTSYPASLTEVASGTGTTQTIYNGLNGLSTTATDLTWGIAIDGAGNIWYANESLNGVSQFNPSIGTSTTKSGTAAGTPLSESGGFTPGLYTPTGGSATGNLLASPYSIAVDAAGALWVTNYNGTSVVQILGPAAPTVAVQANQKFGVLP